jgi:hypothetical protein
MITRHVYGRSINFQFNPLAGDESVPAHSIVTARIYADEPTAAQKNNTVTTGAIGSDVTEWTEGQRGSYSIVFPALTDDDPESSEDYEPYFVTTRFRFELDGPVQSVTEQIFVYRPDALTSKISVRPNDIVGRESKIGDILPRKTFIDEKIRDAITRVDRILRNRGYNRKRTFNRELLNEAVELLATAYCCLDLSGQGNEFWAKKFDIYNGLFEEALTVIPVGVDTDGDDRPTPNERAFSGAVAIIR